MSVWPDLERYALIDGALKRVLDLDGERRAAALAEFAEAHPSEADQLNALLAVADPDSPGNALPPAIRRALLESLLDVTAPPPERLGDWRIVRRLGHGGMAEVWLAEGEGDHLGQSAAIKRPLPNAATADGLARFLGERMLLASIDDPRIARLIDSGKEPDGRPWFALEFVDGIDIDQWCDARKADIRTRVALLQDVAHAVHAAHGALIIHRDIKPSNVLIDSDGRVKLLDFGIAKRIEPSLPAGTSPTLGLALTPQYASPEQLIGATLTTASDIWQLGRLLLELLIGAAADDRNDGDTRDLAQLNANARARETDAPSRRLAAMPAAVAETIASARGLAADALKRAVAGDLDAIMLKALATDPARRYASADALATDLAAWLDGHPVSARPPTLLYRTTKMLRRNPLSSALAVVVFVLCATLVATTVVRSIHARQEAEAAIAVRDYLIAILRQADPLVARTPKPTAAGVLDAALAEARGRFVDQPRLLAEVLFASAGAAMRDGDYPRAEALLDEAVANVPPSSEPRGAELLSMKGRALHYSSRYAESELVLRAALAIEAAHGWPARATTALALSDLLHSRGDYRAAEVVLTQQQPAPGDAYQALLFRRMRAVVSRDSGDLTAASEIESVLAGLHHHFPDDRAGIADTETALARADLLAGRSSRAKGLLTQALVAQRRIYGVRHPVIGIIRHGQALALSLDGHPREAITLLDAVLAEDYALLADANVLKAYAWLDRAWLELEVADYVAAEGHLTRAEATLEQSSGAGHPRLAEARLVRAMLALARGSIDTAREQVDAAISAYQRQFGEAHALTLDAVRWRDALDGLDVAPRGPRLADRRFHLWLDALAQRSGTRQ